MKKTLLLFFCLLVFSSPKAQQDTAIKDTVYSIVQVMPKFRGDINSFFSKNLRYPVSAISKHIEGTVYISFILEKDGTMSNIFLQQSASPALDEEALRLVSSMPKWSPGYEHGKAVRVQCTLPVKFSLDNLKPPDTGNKDSVTH